MFIEDVDRFFERLEEGMIHLAWIVTLLMTIMIVTDVLLRFLFNHPLPASFEISAVAMPYIVIVGFAYTLNKGIHVRVSMISDRLSERTQLWFRFVRNIVSFAMCVLLTYWSFIRFWDSFLIGEEMLAAISIPWWIGKFGMPIGFAMFGIRFLIMIAKDFRTCRQGN